MEVRAIAAEMIGVEVDDFSVVHVPLRYQSTALWNDRLSGYRSIKTLDYALGTLLNQTRRWRNVFTHIFRSGVFRSGIFRSGIFR